ncbi:hypothetical protein TeGR_g14703, partial [Tetraparma gracilis]
TLPIDFAPLVLHLTFLPRAGEPELTLLVSSSDLKLVVYQRSRETGLFEEVKDAVLPSVVSSPVMSIDTTTTQDRNYHVALGMKDGNVRLYTFSPTNPTPAEYTYHIDGPISCVQLSSPTSSSGSSDAASLRLLVASLAGFACIYTLGAGGKRKNDVIVPSVLTSGKTPVLCIYGAPFSCEGGFAIFVGDVAGNVRVYDEGHRLLFERCFSAPIHRVAVGDVDGDGQKEVVVLSKTRIHVLRRSNN